MQIIKIAWFRYIVEFFFSAKIFVDEKSSNNMWLHITLIRYRSYRKELWNIFFGTAGRNID